MKQGIAEDLGEKMHAKAILWVLDLIIDLKEQLSGFPVTREITLERLDEFAAHYRDLSQCRRSPRPY